MSALYDLAGKIAGPDLRLVEIHAQKCHMLAVARGEVTDWREARDEARDRILDAALDRAYAVLSQEIDSVNFDGEFSVRVGHIDLGS